MQWLSLILVYSSVSFFKKKMFLVFTDLFKIVHSKTNPVKTFRPM